MQPQKLQNDLCSFPRQTIQYHGNPSLCPNQLSEEAEAEQFYEDLQDLLELTTKNDRILKQELPRSVGAQYATGDQWRNNSRKNEGREPKQKQYPAVDVTGDRSKV